jgi:hypothetical protein
MLYIFPVPLLNLRAVHMTHTSGLRGTEVLMTKYRTITGFVAIALLAAATTAATMRSPSPSTDRLIAPASMMSFKELRVDVNKLPTDDFDDQSLVYSTKR